MYSRTQSTEGRQDCHVGAKAVEEFTPRVTALEDRCLQKVCRSRRVGTVSVSCSIGTVCTERLLEVMIQLKTINI